MLDIHLALCYALLTAGGKQAESSCMDRIVIGAARQLAAGYTTWRVDHEIGTRFAVLRKLKIKN